MSAENEFITIGKFYLEHRDDGKIWIEEGDGISAFGDGIEVKTAKLEKVIADFYKDNVK